LRKDWTGRQDAIGLVEKARGDARRGGGPGRQRSQGRKAEPLNHTGGGRPRRIVPEGEPMWGGTKISCGGLSRRKRHSTISSTMRETGGEEKIKKLTVRKPVCNGLRVQMTRPLRRLEVSGMGHVNWGRQEGQGVWESSLSSHGLA